MVHHGSGRGDELFNMACSDDHDFDVILRRERKLGGLRTGTTRKAIVLAAIIVQCISMRSFGLSAISVFLLMRLPGFAPGPRLFLW